MITLGKSIFYQPIGLGGRIYVLKGKFNLQQKGGMGQFRIGKRGGGGGADKCPLIRATNHQLSWSGTLCKHKFYCVVLETFQTFIERIFLGTLKGLQPLKYIFPQQQR